MHNIDPSAIAAMNVSRKAFRFFWMTVTVGLISFGLGAVLLKLD